VREHTPNHGKVVAGSSNRSFGLIFSGVFLIAGLLPLLAGNSLRYWALAVSGVFLAVALLVPSILGPFNRIWTKFGALLHRIVSPVALAILFFCVVTPTGLLLRLFGKDVLRLRFDKTAASYWIPRTPPGPAAESLKNQF
jgi:hypothetical protein